MDFDHEEDGYRIQTNDEGVIITTPDGRALDIQIPNIADLGLDASLDTEHAYVAPFYAGPNEQFPDYNELFQDVQEGSAPDFDIIVDETEINGSQSHVPFMSLDPLNNNVTHYVDRDDGLMANVTQPHHFLHPGLVIKLVDQNDTGTHIVTFGVGNGAFPRFSKAVADPVWNGQNSLVGLEATLETWMPIWQDDDIDAEPDTPAYRLAELFTGQAMVGYVADPDWARGAEVPAPKEGDYYGFETHADAPVIAPENLDASLYWAHDYLTAQGSDIVLSGEARADVAQMYDAASDTGDAPMMRYLQDTDFHLAEQEIAAGVFDVAPVVGASMAADVSTAEAMPANAALYNDIAPISTPLMIR